MWPLKPGTWQVSPGESGHHKDLKVEPREAPRETGVLYLFCVMLFLFLPLPWMTKSETISLYVQELFLQIKLANPIRM